MTLRFTPPGRRQRKATVVTRHTLSGVDLFKVLAQFHTHCSFEFTPPDESNSGDDLTPRQAEQIIREAVTRLGTTSYLDEDDWRADYTEEEAASVADWAQRQVRRLYPAGADEQFEQYVREFGER